MPENPPKINYKIFSDSTSSQRYVGTYPPGTTRKEVEALVKGTFGGRFVSFQDGRFVYIAYTE